MSASRPGASRSLAVALALSLAFVWGALIIPGPAQALVFYGATSESMFRGSSDGFANEFVDDEVVNMKMEAGTGRVTDITLLPNWDLANQWNFGGQNCAIDTGNDFYGWDELDENPPDGSTSCRRARVENSGVLTQATEMQDVAPPGVIDDYDITASANVLFESGPGFIRVGYLSTTAPCGADVGDTTFPSWVDVAGFLEKCNASQEWTTDAINGLGMVSECHNTGGAGTSVFCQVTQHKVVVHTTFRNDFSVNFTSLFDGVSGSDLAVRWKCSTTDDEGLDLYVDGVLTAKELCHGFNSGVARIADIPNPRTVDVRLVSPSQVGDVTESTYSLDVLRIEGNRLPLADAGPDQTVLKKTLVRLNGSASLDPDGDVVSFYWAQLAGPQVLLVGANTATPTFTPLTSGTYVFRLTADDGFGGTADDFVTVTVLNRGPVADAGPDQTVLKKTLVRLNGSASLDPDGDVMSFSWTQLAGPQVLLVGANTATPTFTPLTSGMYVFRLTADDGFSGTADDFVTVTALNRGPVADAGPDQTAKKGTTVMLDGRASIDPDGDAVAFAWTQTGGPVPVALDAATVARPSFTPTSAGVYTFQLQVEDGDGGAQTDAVTVTIWSLSPVARLTVPPAAVGDSVILDGAGSSDPDGTIVNYSFDFGDGAGASGSPSVIHAYARPGTYIAVLTVRDNDGNSSVAQVAVTVSARGGPLLDAPAPMWLVLSLALAVVGLLGWAAFQLLRSRGTRVGDKPAKPAAPVEMSLGKEWEEIASQATGPETKSGPPGPPRS